MSEARSRRAGGATQSELMGVGFKNLIVNPNCEFLGAAGGRKKERRFFESEGEAEEKISTCRLVHLREDYILSTPTLVPRFGLDSANQPSGTYLIFFSLVPPPVFLHFFRYLRPGYFRSPTLPLPENRKLDRR